MKENQALFMINDSLFINLRLSTIQLDFSSFSLIFRSIELLLSIQSLKLLPPLFLLSFDSI